MLQYLHNLSNRKNEMQVVIFKPLGKIQTI